MRFLIRQAGRTGGAKRILPNWLEWIVWSAIALFLTWSLVQVGRPMLSHATAPIASATILIETAEFMATDATTLPPEDARWYPATLPHRVNKPVHADLVGYWYKAHFILPPAGPLSGITQPLWLYLPRLTGGGTVYVNGALVGAMPSADAATHVRLFYPNMFLLPPSVLHVGANHVALHFFSREPRTSVSAFEIGPERLVRFLFERRQFVETTTAEIAIGICLMTGLGVMAFWLRRPQEQIYGLLALALLFWGLRTLVMRWPVVPIAYLVEWRLAYYIAHSGFIVAISIFTLHFSQQPKPRFQRLMIGYAITGCLVFAVIGTPARGVMDSYWQMPFLLCGAYCLAHLLWFASRERGRASLAMGLAMLLALGLAIHDFSVQEGWFHLSDIYLMHLGVPVLLLVMAGMVSQRFLDSLASAESANEQLALRVAEREQELALSYERLSELQRLHGATEERQRIMRDMHDGVGTHLLTTMAIVETGSASRIDTMALLQECLDDMRLVIDSLAPDDPDLLHALGSFRFRMQARLARAGISLHWHTHGMPESLEVGTHTGLQILRILQEAMADVLKHARAVNVTIDLHYTADRLLIRVVDDGPGVTANGSSDGISLVNMRNRAEQIGAVLTFEHLLTGTSLQLEIALPSPVAANAILG